ncbi:G-D-S-L family lipolytic protein [Salinimicrobium soli]|uniref:G-D-S-L family lipolytic protein n=1 Tax=Salinimicrobium soli TaxID=1254399 RepID=UPI003AABB1CB
MKKHLIYIGILALGFASCEPEFENPVDSGDLYSNGEADFSTYVALGNSLTAGYADNALTQYGQTNSYPNILAQQFSTAGGGEFTQPLMADNIGGLLLNGEVLYGPKLVLAFDAQGNPAPKPLNEMPTTELSNHLSGSFNNMAVPGAKSFHLVAANYGSMAGLSTGAANPYFVRFASEPGTTVVADAVAQNPTFFTLWIGSNDVLSFALSGGTGVDQTGNFDPTTYSYGDITDPMVFEQAYKAIVGAMTANGAKGALLTVPDVTKVPYFTTVPNNALVLTAEQAAGLTGYFQAVAGIFTQFLMQQQVPAEQAQAIAAQYAIKFNAGPNRFIIDVPVTQTNPLGFRQMTEEELLLLTINQTAIRQQGYGSAAITPDVMQVLGILQSGGQPTAEQAQLVLNAVNGIDDKDVLDSSELNSINTARAAYNQVIEQAAQKESLAFVDVEPFQNALATGGISFDSGVVTDTFGTGGAFSLDGIHLTPRGYAIVANEVIAKINETYNSTVPKVNIGAYGTITPSNNVQ